MLYRIRDGFDCKEDNPELAAIPEFKDLTDMQFRVVALVADRRSPLRTLSERDRRIKACLISGYGMEGNRPDKNSRNIINKKVESIERAIAKYQEYQFDPEADLIDTLNQQIDEIKEFLKSDKRVPIFGDDKKPEKVTGYRQDHKALESAIKLSSKLVELVKNKKEIESVLGVKEDIRPEITTYTSVDLPDETPEGDQNLSTIDQFWQSKEKK